MKLPLSKPEQLNEIIDTINLINHVRTELNSYYPQRSSNPCYKVNCKIDQDRLEKAMNKLTRIQTEIEYELNNLQSTPGKTKTVPVRSVAKTNVHS